MVNEGSRDLTFDMNSATEVAESSGPEGATRRPTACVLPTQGSVAATDREALGEYAARRAERRMSESCCPRATVLECRNSWLRCT